MEELLKELGYTDEQIKAILDGMKDKKIFTSAEENIDTRYSKLNEDFQAKEKELTTANELIEQLKNGTKGNEDLQNKVSNYEAEIERLKTEQHQKDIDNQIRLELLAKKANPDDIEYLIFKIKEKEDKNNPIDVDDKGKLKNFNMEDVEKEYKSHFEDGKNTFVDVKKLGGEDKKDEGDQEPKDLKEALMNAYMPKEDL